MNVSGLWASIVIAFGAVSIYAIVNLSEYRPADLHLADFENDLASVRVLIPKGKVYSLVLAYPHHYPVYELEAVNILISSEGTDSASYDNTVQSGEEVLWLRRHGLRGIRLLDLHESDGENVFSSGSHVEIAVMIHPSPPQGSSLWLSYLRRGTHGKKRGGAGPRVVRDHV